MSVNMAEDRLSPIITDAVNKLASTAGASGYFEGGVLTHEPKSGPGPGLTFATWIGEIKPIAERSGLAVTSVRVPMVCRIYRAMLTEPQDEIDTKLAVASAYLLTQLTADFGITGAYIDLEGAYGEPLGTDLGYVELDDNNYRIADTIVPFIADDVFDQEV